MKFNKILLLPLLMVVTACDTPSVPPVDEGLNYIERNALLKALTDTYNVKATGRTESTYPEIYAHYNEVIPVYVNRDYAHIDANTPAMRENIDGVLTTYFRNEEGYAVSQYYNADNTVGSVEYKYMGARVLFNDLFANPFDFVDASDINEDYTLNPVKASFIANKVAGLDVTVKKAQFEIKDGLPVALNYEIYDREDAIITYELEEILVTNSYELKLEFSFDVQGISKLSPRPEGDETITNALKNKTNYTLSFQSNATTDTLITYVTEDTIFVHKGINTIGPVEGDVVYKKVADNNYDAYYYRTASSKFNFEAYNVTLNKIVPSTESVSSALFTKQSENVYELDQQASLNTLHNFVVPQYAVTKGEGRKGVFTLKNGNLSSVSLTFGTNTIYSINETYQDFGTTTLPEWLDLSSID